MDSSFIRLTKDEYINRINIDPRLIDSFKRVMHKIQGYFNANGYIDKKDYKKYFEEYLLDGKFSIQLNNEPSKYGFAGFYDKECNRICIDIKYINDDKLDSILCHEFIHFLVMHDLKLDDSSPEIYNGGFINEALTEMLTQQIYPNNKAYEPQVNMLKYVNELAGTVNNYSLFLQGYIDCHGYGSSWSYFKKYVEKYQEKYKDKGYSMSNAVTDEDYIKAQWEITNSFINLQSIKTIDDYIEKINILIKRPVFDFGKFNDKVNEMIKATINNLGLSDIFEYNFFRKKLIELTNNLLDLKKYNEEDVYTLNLNNGYELAINKNGNALNMLPGMQVTRYSYDNVINIKYKDVETNIDLSNVDFTSRRKELKSNIQTIKKYFDKDSKVDLNAISKVIIEDNLVSLKKYTLPRVAKYGNKKSTEIYVAQYFDRLEILGDYKLIGIIDNIELNKYIGVTSLENGLICFDKIDNINKGYVLSVLNSKQLNNKCIFELIRQLEDNISKEQLNNIITLYKNSEEYFEDTNDLEYEALYYYASNLFKEMDEFSKKQIIDKVILENEKFVISNSDSKIDISLLFGDQNITSFIAEEQTLIDKNDIGLYNELYTELKKDNIRVNNTDKSVKFELDTNMIFDENITENYKLYVFKYLYRSVCLEIENLMCNKQNTPNYEVQLNKLLKERDGYLNKIDEILIDNKKVM